MVTVLKSNGKIRLCLYPNEVNKFIKREFYQIPSVEEILADLYELGFSAF